MNPEMSDPLWRWGSRMEFLANPHSLGHWQVEPTVAGLSLGQAFAAKTLLGQSTKDRRHGGMEPGAGA